MFKYLKKLIIKQTKEYKDVFENACQLSAINTSNKVLISKLKEKIAKLEADSTDPKALVNAITNNGIEWFDYHALNREQLQNYYTEANHILSTKVFHNEINKLISEWANFALRGANDWQAVRDMRMQTSALDLLKERLKKIPNPQDDYKPTQKNLHSVL